MHYSHKYIILLVLILISHRSMAGVIIGASKIYYTDEMNYVDISIRNTGSSQYLIVSKIMSENTRARNLSAKSDRNFAVIPPAFSLSDGAERIIRVTQISKSKLPENKESLHFLSVTAIPEGKVNDNTVQIAVRSWIKLIYRPAKLIRSGMPQLEWRRNDGKLQITNKSPYYVFFATIEIDGVKVNGPVTLEPLNSANIEGCAKSNSCKLSYNIYNEDGSQTEMVSMVVN